ncbi:MAG: alpha/beta hydrolase [Gemmatimonadota bacterium]|nr:alpha/beta hydrolase [Gemmatimonadota bacterium]
MSANLRRPAVLLLVAAAIGAVLALAGIGPLRGKWSALQQLAEPGWKGIRCLVDGGGEEVALEVDGYHLTGRLHRGDPLDDQGTGRESRPPILLVHGSYPEGKDAPFPLVLSKAFAERGHPVLALDLRGFGSSEKPRPPYTPESFAFEDDVLSGLDSLAALTGVEVSKIVVLGHSFGGGVALAARRRDPRIRRMALFGPPRRFEERIHGPEARERRYFLRRLGADVGLSRPPSYEEVGSLYRRIDLTWKTEELLGGGPLALLLVDAERETRDDRRFLRRAADDLGGRASYWTVSGTDHYLGTASPGPLTCWNRKVVDRFVARTARWLDRTEG